MKKVREKLSAIIALACVVNISAGITAKAEEIIRPRGIEPKVSLPLEGEAKKGENQPFQHGYRSIDIENWDFESDSFAKSMRAHVPLQERIDPLAETQANPNLNPETSLTNLNGDYGNSFFESTAYTNEFSQYAYNFWQYTDYYGGWHGMATDGVPLSLYVDDFDNPKFEFGILNLPNPAYTNAAHKNGVKSIGCLFIPRSGQPYDALLKQDENGEYVVAKKLIEIKEYFGFDGYFINQETSISPDHIVPYKEFTKTLVDAGVYTQWYDCVDDEKGKLTYKPQLLPSHSSFVLDKALGRVNDSIFMNYNWNSPDGWNNGDSTNTQYVDASVAEAERIGINPLDSVLMGVEVSMGKFDGSHNSTRNMDVILDENGNPRTGIALFTPDYVSGGLDEDLGDKNQNRRGNDNYQWMIAERERMFYTGVTIDPLDVGEKKGYSRPDVGVKDASEWGGVSKYIVERSVIDGSVFNTNFNTGHGMNYYVDGQVSNGGEWSNMNLQDILPTWQWWIDTEGDRLQVDFDYGDEIDNGEKFTYKQVGGYKGGSSLVVNGTLNADNYLRLFKTDLDVRETSKATITYQKVSGDNAENLSIGVIFKDNTEKVEYIEVAGSSENSDGWVTETIDLSQYAGREIAVIGLGFGANDGEVSENYQVNIGEIKIVDNKNYTPNAPKGFKVSEYLNTNEAYVQWDLASYDEVKQYNVYADVDGSLVYLGGAYDNVYYIKDVPNGTKNLIVKAVGADGSESKGASIEFSHDYKISGLEVSENEESLDIIWNNPSSKYKEIKVEVALNGSNVVYSEILEGNTTNVNVPVEKGDGKKYTVKVSTMQNKNKELDTVTAVGKTKDTYSNAFDGGIKILEKTQKDGSVIKYLDIETPKSKDWWDITVTINGQEKVFVRGLNELNTIVLPEEGTIVELKLKDYDGNISEVKEFVVTADSVEEK